MLRIAAAALVITAASCGGKPAHLAATRISVTPTPTAFTLTASTRTQRGTALLQRVARAVPNPMPSNPPQGSCATGTTVTVTADARVHRYGPCVWPRSVERLRQVFLIDSKIDLHPPPTVGAFRWRSVFADWYDGSFDRWHPCGAVREAIRHLPSTTPMFSSVGGDLRAYAHGVC